MTPSAMPPSPGPVDGGRGARVYAEDRAHVFHSWSAQQAIDPLPLAAADGSFVWDFDGRAYLDLSSQLVNTNIGHQHRAVVAAIQEQAAHLCTIAPQHANEARSTAARLIAERAPEGMTKIFFTNSGAEAIENAVRMARLHTGRHKVLTTYRSYHGHTQTAVTMTGDSRRWANEPWGTGVAHVFGPFLYRSPFHSETLEQERDRALQHLEQTIRFEGPDTIAAVVMETVPGSAGVLVPPPGYLAGVREICDEHGILLVLDEVMCGFGRTGRWFALEDHLTAAAAPDLITFAKGVNSGYVPLGGVVMSDQVAATFDHRPYPGGLTYSGHPLACAAAVATITTMAEEGIVERARAIGESTLGPGLADLAQRHRVVGEVRGVGVMWAMDLVSDRRTRSELVPYPGTGGPMAVLGDALRRRGVLPLVVANRLHVVPPCTISADEVALGLRAIDESLAEIDELATG
jgi:taurine--2-oxoglutarate transaminase